MAPRPKSFITHAARQLTGILLAEADAITTKVAQAYVALFAPTQSAMLRVVRGVAPGAAEQYEALPLLMVAWVDAEAQIAAIAPLAQARRASRRGSVDPAGRLLAKLQRGWRQTVRAPALDRQIHIANELWIIAQHAAEAAVLGESAEEAVAAELAGMGLVLPTRAPGDHDYRPAHRSVAEILKQAAEAVRERAAT